MFRIIDPATAPTVPMEDGRGATVPLVDQSLGTQTLDLHLNRLVAGGPNGKLHRHSEADNVYIVKSGEGRLLVNGEERTIRAGEVVYIAPGTPHSLSNVSNSPFEIFEIYAPAGAAFDFILE